MPNFKEIQGNLQRAKRLRKQSQQALFLTKEKLARLQREKERLLRSYNPNSDLVQRIVAKERVVQSQMADFEGQLKALSAKELNSFLAFEPLTDPREYIQQFSDEYPILLFPVRLETRFKKITTPEGVLLHQLWVRIFPDQCSIDTFEPNLSEAEITNARAYWLSVWSAGQSEVESLQELIQNKLKAAWKKLASSIQPGRAYWITLHEDYQPLNKANLPQRISQEEVLLIIPTENLPSDAMQNALKNYWAAYWLANGNLALSNAAFNQLVEAAGSEEQAASWIENYVPFNYKNSQPSLEGPPPVKVAFLHFPEILETNSQLSSWTAPARVTTWPERFVLIGQNGIEQQPMPDPDLHELGNLIPDPLIVGPDPSADLNTLLKGDMLEDFGQLNTEEEKTEQLSQFYENLKSGKKAEKSQENFIAEFLALSQEEQLVALHGIFDDFRDDIKAVWYMDYLCQRSETKWLFDFDEAVKMGLGFKIDLSPELFQKGFDRLFVLGVKLRADETEAKTTLEELIRHHHFGNEGFSILPQGTPTNNTEEGGSGFSEVEDPEKSFERYLGKTSEEDPTEFYKKKDGKWLSELLGIDADEASLKLVANYFQTDQCEAKAMNIALWPTTIGYFMESMMTPVFSAKDVTATRDFFIRFVSGRGNLPAIRIGNQPYGILTTTTVNNMKWLDQDTDFLIRDYPEKLSVFRKFYNVLTTARMDWQQFFLPQVPYVGKEGDVHQNLLGALGLHATSVELYQRYAESYPHLIHILALKSLGGLVGELDEIGLKLRAVLLLDKLGFTFNEGDDPIPILDKYFFTTFHHIKGNLIDDQPLSEKNPIRAYTAPELPETEGENYICWLIENAKKDFDIIKRQQGFADQAPSALLYRMLRHALELEFSNSALNYYQSADILDQAQAKKAKIDPAFIGIQVEEGAFQSKYDYLDAIEPRITDQEITVAQHISNQLLSNVTIGQLNNLRSIIAALHHLKDVPTARLERTLIEHLDCCSYRLDAWLLAFVHLQLYGMRYSGDLPEEQAYKPGIYLGAYGWVENLRPDNEVLEQASLKPELKAIFDPDGKDDLVKDSSNAGYIHAPSINQAVTASILRNAYIPEASPQDPEVYKVNLTSERVRMALAIIEGIQQGQSLGALLGYQLERGMHDRYEEAEVDTFIYELRKAFPLVANKVKETVEEEELESIVQIEARNVVDGLALVNHVMTATDPEDKKYPFGKNLKTTGITDQMELVINSEVERIININDAVADLAIAEPVHQVVQGNFDRAGGVLNDFSKGGFPKIPELTRTPRSGITLTHRIGIHLQPGLVTPSTANPRTKAEPAINHFLSKLLPPLDQIWCKAVYKLPTYGIEVNSSEQEVLINMEELGLNAIDLLYLPDIESDKNLTALDDYILKFIHETETPRPDIELEIKYTAQIPESVSLFAVAPLLKSLKSLILAARPLRKLDISLPNQSSIANDSPGSIDIERINSAINEFKENFVNSDPLAGIDLITDSFIALIVEEDFALSWVNKEQIIAGIDDYLDLFVNRLYTLSRFGIPHSGFGFIYDRKAAIYNAFYKIVLDYEQRWQEKNTSYEDLISVQLPAAATDEEKLEILQKAENTISAITSVPTPTIPDYLVELNNKKSDFDIKHQELKNFLTGNFLKLKDLMDAIDKIKTGLGTPLGISLEGFDLLSIETEEAERQIIILAEDLKIQAVKLDVALKEKNSQVEELLSKYEDESDPAAKVNLLTESAKALFGEDFKIIPEFNFDIAQAQELQKSFAAQNQLLSYQVNDLAVDFPVDNWLYGIARVREKMGHWENTVMLSEGFRDLSLDLTPLQLPYREGNVWLGLSFPETYEIDSDRLLYTAYLQDFESSALQCGILIDEWTEVIPTKTETTGLSFQYDQPNAEPPQSLLLVTPSEFVGRWNWTNLVDTLHQTLDLAKLRAVEPEQIDLTEYAQFLPATVAALTRRNLVTASLNYSIINGLETPSNDNENG